MSGSTNNVATNLGLQVSPLYFEYYGKASNQMNILEDHVRTSRYSEAILANPSDFKGKVVLDVGAGTGILSFFASQAEAAKVYPVEASKAYELLETILSSNPRHASVLKPINKMMHEVEFEDDLGATLMDTLVSEPIGTFLLNERMLETYIMARDRFLKPGGAMYPSSARLYLCPFSDGQLHVDVKARASFWENKEFFGVNISGVGARALEEAFRQPILDTVDPRILVGRPVQRFFDFKTIHCEEFQNITIGLEFAIDQAVVVHGLCGWFDVYFEGTDKGTVTLETSPWSPVTHWQQIRFLLRKPLAVNAGQLLSGEFEMTAHSQQSYFIEFELGLAGTDLKSRSATIDLKDPDYRWFQTGHTPMPVDVSEVATGNKFAKL